MKTRLKRICIIFLFIGVMMRKLMKCTTRNMILLNTLTLLLAGALGGCVLFEIDKPTVWDCNYEVLYVNNTKHDLNLIFAFPAPSLSGKHKISNRKHLLPAGETFHWHYDDFGANIDDNPVKKYFSITGYRIISLQIEKKKVRVWNKESRGIDKHSTFHTESWEVFKDYETKSWIKFTIEESDLEK